MDEIFPALGCGWRKGISFPLCSCPALRVAPSGSGCLAPCLWLGVCSRRGCCLLSLLLRADSLPALVTRLKPSCFLTSDCKVKPFMKLVREMVPCCLVLLCITFFSLELADRAAVECFSLLKCCTHLREHCLCSGQDAGKLRTCPGEGSMRGDGGQDAGVGANLWVHCGLCGVWLCFTVSQTLVFTDVKASHRKIIKRQTNLSRTTLAGF